MGPVLNIIKLILKRCLLGALYLLSFDIFIYKLRYFIIRTYVFRLNKRYNKTINFIPQGSGDLIISGDISKFDIHETSHLKSGTFIEASGGVSISENVHFGRGLTIYSTQHNYRKSTRLPYDDEILKAPVKISKDVWIGANVTIIGSVSIGEASIVGANSTVVKDIAPYCIYAGCPAKKIGEREQKGWAANYVESHND